MNRSQIQKNCLHPKRIPQHSQGIQARPVTWVSSSHYANALIGSNREDYLIDIYSHVLGSNPGGSHLALPKTLIWWQYRYTTRIVITIIMRMREPDPLSND